MRVVVALVITVLLGVIMAPPAVAHESGYCGHGERWHWSWSQMGWHVERFASYFDASGNHFHRVTVQYRAGALRGYVAVC